MWPPVYSFILRSTESENTICSPTTICLFLYVKGRHNMLHKDTTPCRHKYFVKWEWELTVWVAFLIYKVSPKSTWSLICFKHVCWTHIFLLNITKNKTILRFLKKCINSSHKNKQKIIYLMHYHFIEAEK